MGTFLDISADLELDLEWKVWEKWIGSVPPQIHKSGSVPMSGCAMLYLIEYINQPGSQFNWGKNPGENPGENPDENPGENPVKKLQ